MGERLIDGRYDGAIGHQTHRRLDLDARQPRRFRAREEACQVLLEGLLNLAPRRAGVAAREAAGFDVPVQCHRKPVGGQRRQLRACLDDDDIGHIPPPAPEGLAFAAFVENLREPTFGQQRFNEGRQLARRGLANHDRSRSTPRLPAPFEAIVGQATERFAMPGDEKIERRLVSGRLDAA